MQTETAYVPIAVPTKTNQKNSGRTTGIIGIICAILSLGLLPLLLGAVGITLGIVFLKSGQRNLGVLSIILSVVFMVTGMILSVINGNLDEAAGFIFGLVYTFFQ